MCLQTINDKLPKPEGHGWKVFNGFSGKLTGEFSTGRRPTNEWLISKNYTGSYGIAEISNYQPGFHIFATRSSARNWRADTQIIRKVLYREAYLAGVGLAQERVIVAPEIFITDTRG